MGVVWIKFGLGLKEGVNIALPSVLYLVLFNLCNGLMWGVVPAIQASAAVHVGVDSLNVVPHVVFVTRSSLLF